MSDTRYLELCSLFRDHDFDRMECQDHDGRCCPAGCHDLPKSQCDHYATEALSWLANR